MNIKKISVKLTKGVFLGFFILWLQPILAISHPLEPDPYSHNVLQSQVSGTVTDEEGVPLLGVNILVKGTTNGTQTDFDGAYSINAASGDVLVFSYIGYITKEVEIEDETINITLIPDSGTLDEVVVIGYGSQRREAVTGAVSTVDGDLVTATPVPSFAEALQGRAPGVQVTNTGSPGTIPAVRIRGIGSISFSPNPLYVVDGFPVGGLNDFDNNDIESISVLKDASASAIYGSRAANGVVIVTTKRGGFNKKLEVNLNTQTGFAQEWNRLDLLNREQYLQYGREMLSNNGDEFPSRWSELNTPIYEGATQTYAETDTDYQEEVFRTAQTGTHHLELSAGTENSRYYASFGHFLQEGIMLGTEYKRSNVRFNSDHKLFGDRLRIGQNLTVATGSRENESNTGGRSQIQNIIRGVPYIPILDPTLVGGYRAPDNSDGSDPTNPVRNAIQDRNLDNNVRVLGTAYAGIEILPDLEYKFTAGIDWNNNRNQTIEPIYFDGRGGREFKFLADQSTYFKGIYLSNQLNYNKTLGKHNFDIVAIAERQDSNFELVRAEGQRSSNDLDVLSGSSDQRAQSSISDNTIFSYVGRLNYEYDNKYFLTASLRRDGSSKFSEGFKYATFPGLSVGWNIAEENFLDKVEWLSSLKLRGSWGKVGFEGVGDYAGQAGISNNTSALLDDDGQLLLGSFIDQLANPELEWEITTMTNVGLDIGIFNNRLQFVGEYYFRDTDNLILEVPLPPSQGFSQNTIANVGAMENWGLDFQATYYSHPDNDFKWDLSANIGLTRNEVVELNTDNAAIFNEAVDDTGGFPFNRTAAGDPIYSFFGWKVAGIFQNQGEIDNLNAIDGDATSPYQAGAAPGDLIFQDLNNDGIIDADDRGVIGNFIPDFTYGVNFSGSYKNFFMSMFWNGVQGNDVYNATKVWTEGSLRLFNAGTSVLRAWTPEEPNTNIPRQVNTDPNGNTRTSDRFVEDGSFLRLQNLRIGYSFPEKTLNNISNGYCRKLNLFFSGSNLLTFTNYSGYDPEVGFRFNNFNEPGIDNGSFPRPLTVTVGLEIGF